MTDIFTDIPPAMLTAYARDLLIAEDLPENQLILEQFFPNVLVDRIRFEWTTGSTADYTDAAPFRAFTTPGKTGVRPGRTRKRGKMAPLTMWYALTEEDVLNIREAIDAGGEIADQVTTILDDIDAGVRAIRNRMEIVRADALINGSAAVSENGLNFTVNYGRSGSNSGSAAVSWGTPATATPFADERVVMERLKLKGLGPADVYAIMSEATWQNYLAIDAVRDSVQSIRVYETITDADARSVRARHSLPDVIVYDAVVNTVAGANRQLIPDGTVVYVPKRPVGSTQWGTPVVASDPRVALERSELPGPVAFVERNLHPYSLNSVIDAIGFPVLQSPDSTYALDVS